MKGLFYKKLLELKYGFGIFIFIGFGYFSNNFFYREYLMYFLMLLLCEDDDKFSKFIKLAPISIKNHCKFSYLIRVIYLTFMFLVNLEICKLLEYDYDFYISLFILTSFVLYFSMSIYLVQRYKEESKNYRLIWFLFITLISIVYNRYVFTLETLLRNNIIIYTFIFSILFMFTMLIINLKTVKEC